MPSPLLDQAKLQAQVLVPVLRTLRAELGVERANQLMWRALAVWRRQMAAELYEPYTGSPVERWMAGMTASPERIGDAIDIEMHTMQPDAVEFDVVGCRFAQLFRELGEPELGFALLCAMDETVAEEVGAGAVTLQRGGTITQGAARCDFRYAIKKAGV